jgi:hypothetical protein
MKVLTVVSVVGIPPVLVAGIYGMNFKSMPELEWPWGCAYGLAVIVLSGLIPLGVFRKRKWISTSKSRGVPEILICVHQAARRGSRSFRPSFTACGV